MKRTVLDVLIYLFENYMDGEGGLSTDSEGLKTELKAAGFGERQILKAFDWLQALARQQEEGGQPRMARGGSLRVFTAEEQEKLGCEARGFLLYLEQVGVLDDRNRELVIDRVMALEADEIDLDQLKWIVLMVLFNQPGQEEAFFWMEDLVMDEMRGGLH
jgi:Smg protein